MRSHYGERNGDALSYTFSGKVSGDEMAGTLDLGEYLGARWTARRRGAQKA
jgi:L-seryl-tRNA(Ser) seleniumtransferase